MDNVCGSPNNVSLWVKLLVLPVCVLRVFYPKGCKERKSSSRKVLQQEHVSQAMGTWKEPNGVFKLLSALFDEKPPPRLVHKDSVNVRQCRRKLVDGHYNAAVKVLTSGGVAPFF